MLKRQYAAPLTDAGANSNMFPIYLKTADASLPTGRGSPDQLEVRRVKGDRKYGDVPKSTAKQSVHQNAAAIKDQPVDVSNDNISKQAYVDVKNEPDDVDREDITTVGDSAYVVEDVRLSDAATVKEELDIGATMLQPPDMHFMLQPCKSEPADTSQANLMPQYEQVEGPSEKTTENKQAAAETKRDSGHCSVYFDQVNIASVGPVTVRCIGNIVNRQYNMSDIERKIGERPFRCDVCSGRFTDRASLEHHSRSHTGERPKCHSKIHRGEYPYICEICNKRYMYEVDKENHLKTHFRLFYDHYSKTRKQMSNNIRTEGSYSCEVCNKRFILKHNLTNHFKIHALELPFSCEVCNRRFRVKNLLITHLRTHTGEHPFICEVCSQRFTLKGNLKQHMKIHTGERPYSCEVCHKRFILKLHLLNHLTIHTGERPFSCEFCSQRFSLKGNLTKHLKIHIGDRQFSVGNALQHTSARGWYHRNE